LKIQDLTLSDVKEKISGTITNYAHRDRIEKIGLFGSFARGEATNESDLDFIIDFRYKHNNTTPEIISEVERQFQFEEMLQKAFAPAALSIVIMEALPAGSDFKEQVEKDVVWVYG
jgi:predicted nucleotidyltransferase